MPEQAPKVLIVGAARGIGAAIARHLDSEGYAVAVADIDRTGAERTASGLTGPGRMALELDVSDPRSIDCAVTRLTESGWDLLRGLVTVAGIEVNQPVDQLSDEAWERVLRTNLTGHFRSVKACLPMLRRSRGALVAIGSPAGRAAYPGAAAYAASKAGLEAMTRAIAIDCAPEVRANCVLPGTTDTALLRGDLGGAALEEHMRLAGEAVPLGRVAEPAEIAPAVSFLLSEGASYVTGSSLVVDGGLLARIATDY